MKIKSLRPVFIIAAVVVLLEVFVFTGETRPKENIKLVWHTAMHLTEFWH